MDEEIIEYYQNQIDALDAPPKKKPAWKRTLKIIIAAALVIGIMTSFPPITLHTTSLKLYPYFKGYAERYHNIHQPDWYPDFKGDVQSDFRFDYIPSIMQGTGHWTVRFSTSPETAAGYAEQFGGARYEFDLSQYDDSVNVSVEDLGYDAPPEGEDIITIDFDRDFWKGHEDTARVYVIDAVLNWNHPHSSAVIVDEAAGMVELSQLG